MPFKSKNTAESESSEMQELQLLEQELESLEFDLGGKLFLTNVTKTVFKNYVQGTKKTFLEQMEKEELDVDKNLLLAQSSAVKKMDMKNQMEILNLRKAQLMYAEVVTNEQDTIVKLDNSIAEMESKIVEQRKKNGGAIISHNSHVGRLKKIRVYENRLNTATVQLNKLLTENLDLREKIEHYRKQRNVFNMLNKRLQSKSNDLKYQIRDVIDEATASYNIRDENHTKMVNLTDRNSQDYKLYIVEEKEMTRTIAQESKLSSFMNTKNSEKSELAYQEALARQQSFESKAENQQEQEMCKYEKVLASIVNILGKENGDKLMKILKSHSSNSEGKINDLTQAINPVCDRYRKTEEQNFSLFQVVNDLNEDVKKLNHKIQESEIEKKQSNEVTHKNFKNNSGDYAEIKINFQKNLDYITSLETRSRLTFNNFNNIKSKLDQLFKALNCNNSKLMKQLDNHDNVTGQNLELYLSGIENTINRLMQIEALEHASKFLEDGDKHGGHSKPGTTDRKDRKSLPGSRQNSRGINKTSKKKSDISTLEIENVNNTDFIDTIYNDLDSCLLNENSFKDRAIILSNERERNKNVKTPKTPTRKLITPMTPTRHK